jgi:hypothetical protein
MLNRPADGSIARLTAGKVKDRTLSGNLDHKHEVGVRAPYVGKRTDSTLPT